MRHPVYDHYLAMIGPRIRSVEAKRTLQGQSVRGALSYLGRNTQFLVDSIQGLRQTTAQVALVGVVELAGAVNELRQAGALDAAQISESDRIFEALGDCLDGGKEHLREGLVNSAESLFEEWGKYCCLARKESDFLWEFFDQSLGEDVDLSALAERLSDGQLDEFIERARVSDRYQAIILYFDRIEYLHARDMLSRAMSLAKSLGFDTGFDEEFEAIDAQLKSLSEAAEFPLVEDVREWYQPEDFYWWYYSIPKTLKVKYG